MLLTDVRDYLQTRQRATLDEIARHFDVAPDAARGLIETWIAKGKVRCLSDRLPCGTCGKCDSATVDIYEWKRGGGGPAADPGHAIACSG